MQALALVGSFARGAERPDSDIDLVFICADPSRYLDETNWLSEFGELKYFEREDWGLVQSMRAFYSDGVEIEFCITSAQWCTETEVKSGTGRVLRDGFRIILDPHNILLNMLHLLE